MKGDGAARFGPVLPFCSRLQRAALPHQLRNQAPIYYMSIQTTLKVCVVVSLSAKTMCKNK